MSARVRIGRRVFCVRYASQRLYVGVGRDGFVAAGRASRRRFHHASFVASRADRRLRRSPSVDAGDTPLPGVPLSAVYRYRPLSPSMANRIQNRHPPSCVASVLALSGGGPPTSPTSSSSGRFPPKSDEVHARYPATMPEKNSSQTRIGHMLPDVARARAPHDTLRASRSASPRRLPGGDCTTGISTSQTRAAGAVASKQPRHSQNSPNTGRDGKSASGSRTWCENGEMEWKSAVVGLGPVYMDLLDLEWRSGIFRKETAVTHPGETLVTRPRRVASGDGRRAPSAPSAPAAPATCSGEHQPPEETVDSKGAGDRSFGSSSKSVVHATKRSRRGER